MRSKNTPSKYHIHTKPAPPKQRPVGKYGIVDWREDCSSCRNCVKRECVFDVYSKEDVELHEATDFVDYMYDCKSCLSCVQSCTKGLLTRRVNPEYLRLGNDFWKPDVISTTWFQAETGKVPVSGAGYPGPFSGPGFDSMWTDMSEIVRPTRDGIHGREYISTAVDIGRKPSALTFEGMALVTDCPPILSIPIPVMFDIISWHRPPMVVAKAFAQAASELGTIALFDPQDLIPEVKRYGTSIAPCFHGGELPDECLKTSLVVEYCDSENVFKWIGQAKEINPKILGIVRVPAGRNAAERVARLAKEGAEVIHLSADSDGNEFGPNPRHIKDAIREVHLKLVEERLRDEVTLIVSGGIALPEHVAKAIICGADLVAIDIPLMIALECKLCGKCRRGFTCPEGLADHSLRYAVQRIVNLMGAWHSQLLEVLGAMGIREVRRLRGEVGRAMFFEDMERESFGKIFGARRAAGSGGQSD